MEEREETKNEENTHNEGKNKGKNKEWKSSTEGNNSKMTVLLLTVFASNNFIRSILFAIFARNTAHPLFLLKVQPRLR